jgi:nucleoside-triphosphatase THEP1
LLELLKPVFQFLCDLRLILFELLKVFVVQVERACREQDIFVVDFLGRHNIFELFLEKFSPIDELCSSR